MKPAIAVMSLIIGLTASVRAQDGPSRVAGTTDKPKQGSVDRIAHVEGVLCCRDAHHAPPEFTEGAQMVAGSPSAALTGVGLFVPDFGTTDVYLTTDQLRKQAQELNGRRVQITGEIRYFVVVPKWFGDDKLGRDVPAFRGKSIWIPHSLDELPKRRAVVWATGLKPLGPKVEPWAGAPTGKRDETAYHTYKRLPRAADVTSVRIFETNAAQAKPLTVALFPAWLDKLKPIAANDDAVRLEAGAHYCRCHFETSEGEFRLHCYLGGNAILRAPDGTLGWVHFEHPK